MAVGAAALGLGYIWQIEPHWLDLVSLELTLPRLEPAFAGFRLVQISDLHISERCNADYIGEAVRQVLESKPDLVAITGDFIHRREAMRQYSDALAEILKTLSQSVETIAVLGNHDYWAGKQYTDQMLHRAGVRLLENESFTLQRGKSKLHFVGMDDIWDGRPDMQDALSKVAEDGAAVLLAHEPDYADYSASVGRFDLQISGHSHGGQVVLPLIGPPIRPFLGEKYPLGLYRVGNMFQYTNRGIGMASPYIRFNCRPEVTVFTFQPGRG